MKLSTYLLRLTEDLADYDDADPEYQQTMNLADAEDGGFVWSIVSRALEATGTDYPTPARISATEGLAILAKLMARSGPGEVDEAPLGDGPYRVSEAARILGVSTRHVYDLCKEGKIAHRHSPHRITKEALEEHQREAERQPVKTAGFRHI